MRYRDQPLPASAGQHPFPLIRKNRADRARAFATIAILSAALMCHCFGKMRELLDEAEDDCGSARRRGWTEGHRARKHRHGP